MGSLASVCVLTFLAVGCETTAPSVKQPPNVVMIQSNVTDFRQIKACLEEALDAQKEGDRNAFLKGMEKAEEKAAKFLNPAARYKLSDKTVYQFLADRLKDPPQYAESYSSEQLVQMKAHPQPAPPATCPAPENMDSYEQFIHQVLDTQAIKTTLGVMLSDWGDASFAVDDVLTQHVSYFAKYFTLCETEKTNRALERSRKYLPRIQEIFHEYDLHDDIAFAVPFVESRFTTSARSTAGAVGMFQFLDCTARDYGLKVEDFTAEENTNVDERLNWEKTAGAAARYLAKNRNVFGSTILALGAYHHGSAKVVGVLHSMASKSKVRSFDHIFRHGQLGPYSREYIPQCLAAAYLRRVMQQTGFERLPCAGLRYEKISAPVTVANLSTRHKQLLVLNPDLTHADHIYGYASTGGYVLVTDPGGHIAQQIESMKGRAEEERSKGKEIDSLAKGTLSQLEGAVQPAAELGVPLPNDSRRDKSIVGNDAGGTCMLAYAFQEGNTLAELARIFGVELQAILDHPANRRLKERYPRQPNPGDTVIIPGLPSSTTLFSSMETSPSPDYRFYTTENQSLKEIAANVSEAAVSAAGNAPQGKQISGGIAPELIRYWNNSILPKGTGIEDPLRAGIPLFIVTHFQKPEAERVKGTVQEKQQGSGHWP